MKKVFIRTALFLLLLILFFCSFRLCEYAYEGIQHYSTVSSLKKEAVVYISNDKTSNNTNKNEPIKVDFSALQKKNKDIVAWIYCDGTYINYPIVQSKDNEYYLHRLVDGSYNSNGTLFIDCNNLSDFSDFNTIVYGHNMRSGAMFGSLEKYKKQSYYDKHPTMTLFTPNGTYIIELFAGFVTSDTSEIYTQELNEDNFSSFINNSISKSTFTSDTDIKSIDRIITLSTCSYEYENARYVLLGSLKLQQNN